MQMLNRFKIGARLVAAFGLVLLLLCAVAGIGALQIKVMDQRVDDFAENLVPSLRVSNKLNTDLMALRRLESQSLLLGSEKDLSDMEGRIAKLRSGLLAALKEYETLVSDEQDRSNLRAAEAAIQAYFAQGKVLSGLVRTAVGDPGKQEESKKLLFGESSSVFGVAQAAIHTIWIHNEKLGEASAAQASATYDRALLWMGIASAVAVVFGLACALLMTRSIVVPMQQAVGLAERIGAGDLTARVDVQGSDETASLLGALKRMNDNLVGIVGRVRNSSDSIATGSSQIATGNADLSQRTEEQASNLQQTAASMEQLQATVKNNADTARQASQLADGASTVAGEGGAAVARVVETMEQISTSSRRIADIIGTIDGIAFQTNILALNAAVEAARAGEQGRGFAVVATEVRTLAQRSANAAREIKQLIGESVEKVETGSRLCGEAGRTMGDIVDQVKRVADLIGEITSASAEQSQGIGQIGQAVSQLDQVTQQNAALVEESAAAAESLKHQAAELAQTVSQFRLEHSA